jgi:acetyl-CoA carboxylase beta subunit
MLKLAYEERIDNLENCLSTAIDIFGHYYMKTNSEELGYAFEPIYHSDHECYQIIVDQGLAEDIEDAMEKYKSPFDINEDDVLDLFWDNETFEELVLESHRDDFWNFSETANIEYGCDFGYNSFKKKHGEKIKHWVIA